MTANELWAKLYMKAGDDRMFEVSHDNKPLGIMRNSSWNPYPNEYGVDIDSPPADGSEFWSYIELRNFGSLEEGLFAQELAILERQRRRKAKKA